MDPTEAGSGLVTELAEAYAEHAGRLPGALHLGRSRHRGIAVSIHGAQPAAVLAALRRDDLGEAGESLHHQLARRAIPHMIGTKEPHLLALLPSTQRALDPALAVLTATGAPVGVSARLGQLRRTADATREAVWSLGVAKATGRSVVQFADESTLLLPRTLDEASLVVSRILGPLVTYDREHGTELLRTLRVVLATDRSWRRAAAELHVHKQTLGYRIRQIERLTGRSLRSTKDLGELWFGLRAYQLTQGRSPDDDAS